MDQHARPDRTTPLQSVWSMALSAMTVECEWFFFFIYLPTTYWTVALKLPQALQWYKHPREASLFDNGGFPCVLLTKKALAAIMSFKHALTSSNPSHCDAVLDSLYILVISHPSMSCIRRLLLQQSHDLGSCTIRITNTHYYSSRVFDIHMVVVPTVYFVMHTCCFWVSFRFVLLPCEHSCFCVTCTMQAMWWFGLKMPPPPYLHSYV